MISLHNISLWDKWRYIINNTGSLHPWPHDFTASIHNLSGRQEEVILSGPVKLNIIACINLSRGEEMVIYSLALAPQSDI